LPSPCSPHGRRTHDAAGIATPGAPGDLDIPPQDVARRFGIACKDGAGVDAPNASGWRAAHRRVNGRTGAAPHSDA
jgi:hypothetical protein